MTAQESNKSADGLDEALAQFVHACERGEHPDAEELIKRYPEHETCIRRRIGGLREIDALFDSLVQTEPEALVDGSPEHNLVGHRIGGFEIEEVIGRGGMGVVYRARDTRLARSVAVKSMPAKLARDSGARVRFKREARVLASLNHANIGVIHDIIESQDHAGYLVLEYVPGETLAERIKRTPLTMAEVLSIGRQIAEAISAAHKSGVVHRDLKPGNIKITPDGRVKVLDFGLAKSFTEEDKGNETTETRTGRVIGTPAYMSPEQARGKETDHRTDLWSFGCILYQMLTGRFPFEGRTTMDTLARILECEPDWRLLPPTTPANICALLHRCLEKDPDRRLGGIADAVVEITEALSTPVQTASVRLRRMAMTVGIAVVIVLSCVSVWVARTQRARPPSKEIRLVVLPFENLGPPGEEYFADGITDEITARLAGIAGLSVISRQSAMQYKKTEKNTQQIADELRVDYILEGTVQRERPSDPNGRVKIRPQLIRVADDAHVWAHIYENDMRHVFRLQSDVAEHAAQELDVLLLDAQRQAVRSVPTANTEAYNYYLRGNDYSSRPYQDENNALIAIQMYQKAVELDPDFSLAHARLSEAHSGMYQFRYDRSVKRLEMAWEASERALKLAPDLPEAHYARGVCYYWGRRDYARALDELELARKNRSKDGQFLAMIGYVQRAQGKYEQALADMQAAFELNPLDYRLAYEIGNTFRDLGNYTEAEHYYEQAILLAPDEDHPYFLKARLYLVWKGSTDDARNVLEEASQYINLTEEWRTAKQLFELDILDGYYEQALARLPLASPSTDELNSLDALRYAQVYDYWGKVDLAKRYYDEARTILERQVKEYPNDPACRSMLGIAYAGLGRSEEAIREARLGMELVLKAEDSQSYFSAARDLAYVYTKVGEFDAAIDQIKYMLTFRALFSIPLLQLDPAWDPLREHPQVQRLLELGK